ncbi:Protein TRANSPARENT TESTA 12 [Hordeum vulgare]|nr:Protein TRANSPARENT TESTA 12 [Hordeum vulgare]
MPSSWPSSSSGGRSLPRLFSDDEDVVDGAARLGYLLAVTAFFSSMGPVLSGVAVGAGWQLQVAFVNIGCYYLVGIPVGVLLGFKLKLGALALLAAARIKEVGGKNEDRLLTTTACTEDDQVKK